MDYRRLPFPYNLPSYIRTGYYKITMHLRPYLRRSLQGNQKTTGKEILASDTASANSKHQTQPNYWPDKYKTYTESRFISFSFTKYIIYKVFNRKLQGMLKHSLNMENQA